MNKKKISIIGMALIALLLVISGCSSNNASSDLEDISTTQGESLSSFGTIVLKINPEIAIEYDEQGLVTRVIGKNDDGQEIVDRYYDFIGKDSGLVLEELVALINEAGYFVEEVEGEARQIILELESGSVLPEDNFLEVLAMNIQNAIADLNTDADVVKAEDSEQKEDRKVEKPEVRIKETKADKSADQAKAKETSKNEAPQVEYIGVEKGKSIALNHAGIEVSQVRWDDAEFDLDNGVPHYELEFKLGKNEYEYDIHAVTGNIIKFEHAIERKQAPQKPATQAPAKELSKDEAINIALNHAGVSYSQVVFDDVELDTDDGHKKWEIEFEHGNWEYEYDIDASNGNILDFEKEYDD